VHGVVVPMQPPYAPSEEGLAAVVQDARVPVWTLWPLPPSWLVTGFVQVGDERTGSRACRAAPNAKMSVGGHPVPMWAVEAAPDRAAYVGEAMGNWVWVVLWPADTGALMLDSPELRDLREPGMELDLPYGAFCPRLDT
jgi:hypothetical protein